MIIYDDADDANTYAPEIQSIEISPDQLSENENSLNLVEVFSEHYETTIIKSNKNKNKHSFNQSTIKNSNKFVNEFESNLLEKSINDKSTKIIDYSNKKSNNF